MKKLIAMSFLGIMVIALGCSNSSPSTEPEMLRMSVSEVACTKLPQATKNQAQKNGGLTVVVEKSKIKSYAVETDSTMKFIRYDCSEYEKDFYNAYFIPYISQTQQSVW